MNKVYILRKKAAAATCPLKKAQLFRRAQDEAARLAKQEYLAKARPLVRSILGAY